MTVVGNAGNKYDTCQHCRKAFKRVEKSACDIAVQTSVRKV